MTDELGQPVEAATSTEETPDLTAGAVVETPGEDTPSPGASEEPDELAQTRAKLEEISKAKRATTSERDTVKRENAELKAQLEALTQNKPPEPDFDATPGYKDAQSLHPRLKGLNYDPSDKAQAVEVAPGRWVSEREALAMARNEDVAEQFEQSKTAQSRQAEEAQVKAEQERIIAPIVDGIAAQVSKFTLPEAESAQLTEMVENMVARSLMTAGIDLNDPYNLPTDYADKAIAAIESSMATVTKLFGGLSTRQMEGNAKARDQHRAKPDGQPGVQGQKSYEQMTKAEVEAMSIKAAQAAEAMRPSE